MRLLLIRHGHSHHEVTNTIADLRGCQGLTPEGLAQARALSERVRHGPDDAEWPILLSSPVLRAHQTAEVLRESLRLDAIVPLPDLREQAPGEANGLQRDAYRARYGTFNPQHEPDRPFSPGGESWKDFESRVARTLEGLAQRYAGRAIRDGHPFCAARARQAASLIPPAWAGRPRDNTVARRPAVPKATRAAALGGAFRDRRSVADTAQGFAHPPWSSHSLRRGLRGCRSTA